VQTHGEPTPPECFFETKRAVGRKSVPTPLATCPPKGTHPPAASRVGVHHHDDEEEEDEPD
jgi:hypothetical protein